MTTNRSANPGQLCNELPKTENVSATSDASNPNPKGGSRIAGAPEASATTLSGRVVWFSNAKGYGFIKRDDGGADVFIHFSAIQQNGYKTLAENDRVEFELAESVVHVGRVHAVNCRLTA